jgi:fatty acid desaturase
VRDEKASDEKTITGARPRVRHKGGAAGKFILIIIVWVVAICVFTGILLTGIVAWFKHGGHPIILALIVGVVALVVSGIIGARKEKAVD